MNGQLYYSEEVDTIVFLAQEVCHTAFMLAERTNDGEFAASGDPVLFDCSTKDGMNALLKATSVADLVIAQKDRAYNSWTALEKLEYSPKIKAHISYYEEIFDPELLSSKRKWHSYTRHAIDRVRYLSTIVLNCQHELFAFHDLQVSEERVFRMLFPLIRLTLPCSGADRHLAKDNGAFLSKLYARWDQVEYVWSIDIRDLDQLPDLSRWLDKDTISELETHFRIWLSYRERNGEELEEAREQYYRKAFREASAINNNC